MKILKLVTGILCLLFAVIVLFQSCAAGVSNSLSDSGEISGSAGVLVAVCMIAGGIVMLVTRKSEKRGGSIAGVILFLLGALIGMPNAGSFADLKIWSGFCLILGVMNLCALLFGGRRKSGGADGVSGADNTDGE